MAKPVDPNDIALNPVLDALSPPRRVRVIRVLEYDYPDQATAEADMARWGVPPNGVRHGWGRRDIPGINRGTVIRSATTFPETMPHQQEPREDDTAQDLRAKLEKIREIATDEATNIHRIEQIEAVLNDD